MKILYLSLKQNSGEPEFVVLTRHIIKLTTGQSLSLRLEGIVVDALCTHTYTHTTYMHTKQIKVVKMVNKDCCTVFVRVEGVSGRNKVECRP